MHPGTLHKILGTCEHLQWLFLECKPSLTLNTSPRDLNCPLFCPKQLHEAWIFSCPKRSQTKVPGTEFPSSQGGTNKHHPPQTTSEDTYFLLKQSCKWRKASSWLLLEEKQTRHLHESQHQRLRRPNAKTLVIILKAQFDQSHMQHERLSLKSFPKQFFQFWLLLFFCL